MSPSSRNGTAFILRWRRGFSWVNGMVQNFIRSKPPGTERLVEMASPPPSYLLHQSRWNSIYAKVTVAVLLSLTFFCFFPSFSPSVSVRDEQSEYPAPYDDSSQSDSALDRQQFQFDDDAGTNAEGGDSTQQVDASNTTVTQLEVGGGGARGGVCGLRRSMLSDGNWVQDSRRLVDMSKTCRWMANVIKGCKVDKNNAKVNWRWQPKECDLEEFQPRVFLELMKGKTIAFVGDESVEYQARSLLCLLHEVAAIAHEEKGENGMVVRWWFKGANMTVVMVRSTHLVQELSNGGKGHQSLRLDKVDGRWVEMVAEVEVVVVGTGVAVIREPMMYVARREQALVGCHRCAELPKDVVGGAQTVSLVASFHTIMHSVVLGIGSLPGFSGTTIFLPPLPSIHFDSSGPHNNLSSRFALALRHELRLHHRRHAASFDNPSRMFPLLPLAPPLPPSYSSCLLQGHSFLDSYNLLLLHHLRNVAPLHRSMHADDV